MSNFFRKYRGLSFEEKTILHTLIGLCFSTVLASGKLIIGLFSDYHLCTIAIYTFAILLAKLECVLGVKSKKRSFQTRNLWIAIFLFASSAVYIGFMCRLLFQESAPKDYSLQYVVSVAFISFLELGFAIAGILRTKNKGHFYRDIKIINFCVACIAILTTQTVILDYMSTENTNVYNAFAGIGIGCFIALCAVYIYFAPRFSVIDREHNVFQLENETRNQLIDMEGVAAEITLCKSSVYGSYIYRATVQEGKVDGNIERGNSLWKRMHLLLKILCCILSEILLFVWLFGRFVFMLRSINLPARLEKLMNENGFIKIEEPNQMSEN